MVRVLDVDFNLGYLCTGIPLVVSQFCPERLHRRIEVILTTWRANHESVWSTICAPARPFHEVHPSFELDEILVDTIVQVNDPGDQVINLNRSLACNTEPYRVKLILKILNQCSELNKLLWTSSSGRGSLSPGSDRSSATMRGKETPRRPRAGNCCGGRWLPDCTCCVNSRVPIPLGRPFMGTEVSQRPLNNTQAM